MHDGRYVRVPLQTASHPLLTVRIHSTRLSICYCNFMMLLRACWWLKPQADGISQGYSGARGRACATIARSKM